MSLGSNLKRLTESHGPHAVAQTLTEGIASGKIRTSEIYLQDLAENFLGRSRATQIRKLLQIKESAGNLHHVMEAAEAQDASAFSNITGQLMVTEIKKGYDDPEFIGDQLMTPMENPGGNLGPHKIPGLSQVLDKPGKPLEQMEPYPQTKFAETWNTAPSPEKRGQIASVTLEMVTSDLTGQWQEACNSIGKAARYDKEERQLSVVLGLVNNYSWNGNTINTYLATAGVGNYANKLLNAVISNYQGINNVELLFRRMSDPITGRRITVKPDFILCFPAKHYDLKRVINATEVRDATSGIHDVTANPLDTRYPLLCSNIAEALLQAAGVSLPYIQERVYFLSKRSFRYRQVLPFTTVNMPANNPREFEQDVVLASKCMEWGVAFAFEPRFSALSTNEAS